MKSLNSTRNGGQGKIRRRHSPLTAWKIPALQSPNHEGQIILKNPRLWSIEKPQRYVVVTTLAQNGRSVDSYETPFGIRTI